MPFRKGFHIQKKKKARLNLKSSVGNESPYHLHIHLYPKSTIMPQKTAPNRWNPRNRNPKSSTFSTQPVP